MNKDTIAVLYQEAFDAAYAEMKEKDPARYYSEKLPKEEYIIEKFAELIIEECIEIVLSSDPSQKMSVREPYGSIMENIKEHFGVE